MSDVQDDKFIKTGVIGHPIAHSKSPLIHNYWLKKYGIAGEYCAYDIEPGELETRIRDLQAQGLRGFNVTLPHKQAVLNICTSLTQDARKIGAVNTVKFYPNGEIEGHNTDAYGFIENMKQAQPGYDIQSKPVTILGAGGAARAIVYALLKEGAPEIRMTNRTIETAEKLAEDFPLRVFDWDDRAEALKGAGLLVNTTSLGMQGKPALDINLHNLPIDAIVYDIVYVPLMTDLLLAAKARGNNIVTGIGMLLHQARPAFRSWYGTLPDVDEELQGRILA